MCGKNSTKKKKKNRWNCLFYCDRTAFILSSLLPRGVRKISYLFSCSIKQMHYLWSQITTEPCWNVRGMLRYENQWIICQLFPCLWKSALHNFPTNSKAEADRKCQKFIKPVELADNTSHLALMHFIARPWWWAPSVFKCLK